MKQRLKRLLPARATTVEALLAEVSRLRELTEHTNTVLLQMNHELHHGGDSGLPLLVDMADRCRTDAATTIASALALERTIDVAVRRLEDVAERLDR